MNNNPVPSLRFAGFDGDWEQRRFSDIAETRRGLTYSPDDVRRSGIRVLRSSNISEDRFVFGDDDVFVAPEAINIPFAHNGDILITAANGSTRLVGKHAIIKDIAEEPVVHGGFMLLASAENPDFVNALMSAPWYSKFISLYVAGGNGAIGNLNKNDLDEQEIAVPDDAEQKAVGIFFNDLDTLILKHQSQYERLLQTKKAMLLKLFPRPGKDAPEIRFAGFNSPWMQRKLGNLVQFSKGSGYSKSDLQKAGTPIILYGRLYTQYETVITDVDTYADEKFGSVYSRGGDVIVPASGETAEDIAIASVVEQAGVLLGGDLNIITPPDDIDSAFLAISISNGKPHADMAKMAQGKSVVHLHNVDLEKIDLIYPEYDEQVQISAFFRRLDNTIVLHKKRLNVLSNLKKAMLQKMFPVVGRE